MLSKKQKEVVREMYEQQLSEREVLERFGLSNKVFQRWLNSEEFTDELERLCANSARETRLILSRFGPVAAVRLVELMQSEKDDVARRASLELIGKCLGSCDSELDGNDDARGIGDVSDAQAREMLAMLAKGISK